MVTLCTAQPSEALQGKLQHLLLLLLLLLLLGICCCCCAPQVVVKPYGDPATNPPRELCTAFSACLLTPALAAVVRHRWRWSRMVTLCAAHH
jgi:hypothetical protein